MLSIAAFKFIRAESSLNFGTISRNSALFASIFKTLKAFSKLSASSFESISFALSKFFGLMKTIENPVFLTFKTAASKSLNSPTAASSVKTIAFLSTTLPFLNVNFKSANPFGRTKSKLNTAEEASIKSAFSETFSGLKTSF